MAQVQRLQKILVINLFANKLNEIFGGQARQNFNF